MDIAVRYDVEGVVRNISRRNERTRMPAGPVPYLERCRRQEKRSTGCECIMQPLRLRREHDPAVRPGEHIEHDRHPC